MSKCVINPKHKSSRGNLLNISGASEAVMQSSDFMQFSACMTDKNCYLRKKPICTNYRLHFISYRSRNTIEWHCFDAIMDKTCLLGEINFPSIESAGYEETWCTCHKHPGSHPGSHPGTAECLLLPTYRSYISSVLRSDFSLRRLYSVYSPLG